MIASPDSSTAATSLTVCSVISPAGTMIQTARGADSFSASSDSVPAPSAPSPASVLTGSELTS
jgi:hypothetical protein